MAMLFSLVEYGKLRPLAAQSVVMVVSVVLSYLLHRNFSVATGGSNSPSQ
jgi:putative flippase GtrA